MKLVYWTAECLDDSKAYNVREKTKKAALAAIDGRTNYGPVKRVEIEYTDGFDLLTQCLQEDGGYWEAL